MASNDTAALVVALSAQLTKFEKDMDSAYGIADKSVKKIEDRFSKIDPGAGGAEFASKLEKLLTVGGIIGALTTLHDLVAELAKVGDQADRVGLTAEQFQTLRFAVVSTGGSVDSAGSFMDRFSRSISEAGRGAGELYKTFLVNNVAIKDQNGNLLPTTVLLGKFADLVKNAKNAQDAMNLAVLAGGRQAGPEFLNVLRGGAEGLKSWADEATNAGIIASDALIANAKRIESEYNKLWLLLKLGAQGFAVEATNSIKDTWQKLQDDTKGGATAIRTVWDAIVAYVASKPLKFFTDDELRRLEGLGITFGGGVGRTSGSIAVELPVPPKRPEPGKDLGSAGDGSTQLFNEQDEAFKKLLALEDQRIKLLGAEKDAIGLTAGQTEELKTKVNLETAAKKENIPPTEARKAAIAAEAAKVGQAAQAVDDYKRQWANFNNGLQFIGNNAIDILDGLRTKTLTGAQAVQQLTNSLIKAAEQALLLGTGPLANLFGTQSNVAGGTGGIFGGIGNLFKSGETTAAAPLIYGPGFASGTDNAPGGWSWVGEDGPELMNVPKGAQIVPNDISRSIGGGSTTQIVYSPIIDARGADANAVARLAQAQADDRRNFEKNVMQTVRGNLRLDAGALNR